MSYQDDVRDFCRRLIVRALVRQQGNRTRTALALGLDRCYLLRLMRRHGIVYPARFEPRP